MGKDQELLEAARTGKVSVVEKLLSPKAKSGTRSFAASLGIKMGPNVNCQDQSGYTPLHHAALNGHKSVVTLLLQNAASTNVSDNKGCYPLHLAAWNGYADIVNCLLTHGPSVAKVNEQNGDSETSLHCAAQYGHTETVEILLNNGADPMVRNIRDESPLDLASQYGRMDAVRVLLQFQPSLLSRCPERFTPLHLASRNGHKEVAEILLAHGADINRSGGNGSALHEAALFGKPDVVRLLLSRGANPHTLDPKFRTPLELVRQLNTQTSREISQHILARLQDGEDYEPLDPDDAVPAASPSNRSLCTTGTPQSINSFMDMHKAFLERTPANVFDSPPPGSVPQVTVEAHHISPQLRRSSSNASSAPSNETTHKGFGGSWGRSSIGKGILLRRSASARSSKSLPRLPSTRHRSPSLLLPSLDSAVLYRQHHPSSRMFPVSPTANVRRSETARPSFSSLPSASPPLLSYSSPPSPVKKHLAPEDQEKIFRRERIKTDDDSVFLPIRSASSQSQADADQEKVPIKSIENSAQLVNKSPTAAAVPEVLVAGDTSPSPRQTVADGAETKTSTSSPSLNRPKKPARSKLSTVTTPPPIPPKPMSMVRSPAKERPPSPSAPPPDDDDEDALSIRSWSRTSDDGSLLEKRSSRAANRPINEGEVGAVGGDNLLDSNGRDHMKECSEPSKIPVSRLTPSDGKSISEETACGHASIDLPSPTFSPPSPHTAMIEISETLQKAVSQESLDAKNRLNLSSPEPLHSHVMDSSEEESTSRKSLSSHSSVEQVCHMNLRSTSKSVRDQQSSARRVPVSRKDQSTVDQSNAVSYAVPQKHLPAAKANERVARESPKPAKRSKPLLSAKPEIAVKQKDDEKRSPTITPPVAKPRSVGSLRKSVDLTIKDSSECFVTGGAQVKRARILSTKSTETPSVPSPKQDDDLTPKVGASLVYFPPVNGEVIERFPRNPESSIDVRDEHAECGVNGVLSTVASIASAECWRPTDDELDEKTPVNDLTHHYDALTTPASRGTNLVRDAHARIDRTHDDVSSASDCRSFAGDWDEALSDRTEDFEMPREVRKFRGLIRGASYRSRSRAHYSQSNSPYDDLSPFDSDVYGADLDEDCFPSESERRSSSTVLSLEAAGSCKLKDMTLESISRRSGAGDPGLNLPGLHHATPLGQTRRDSRKKRSSRRSDGGDSPLSSSPSSPSSPEEHGRGAIETSSSTRLQAKLKDGVESDGQNTRFGDHIRHDSFYDNNNNNSQASAKLHPIGENASGEQENVLTLEKLPDLDVIVDTVSAVRSRSSQGSSSDPVSSSSASSTLAKMATQPTKSIRTQGQPDGTDEWAQIANVMSSFGGGSSKGSVYSKEFEETFWKIMTGSELPRQVSTWLSELGLPQYEKVLSGNGFDDVDFLAGDILEEQDLIDMNIRDESHRRRLLESAKNLPSIHPLDASDGSSAPASVGEWLSSINLAQYEQAFMVKGCRDMNAVRKLSVDEIKPLVKTRGHFKRIRASLFVQTPEAKKVKAAKSAQTFSSAHTKASPPLSRSPLLESANFFKDYNNIVKSRAKTGDASVVFQSGTVSSTGSGSSVDSHKFAGLDSAKAAASQLARVPEPGQPASDTPAEGSPRSTSSRSRRSRQHKQLSEQSENVLFEPASPSPHHRQHRRKSSRDITRHLPRSRSGSRTRKTELSVFVESTAGQDQHSQENRLPRRSSQKSRSYNKSSSSVKSTETDYKQNAVMAGKSSSSADIPDVERATYLASEAAASRTGGGLVLRPPNEATREVSVGSWRHSPEVLITGCLNYQAYYLGSMLIRELKGVESTVEACAKMKRSTDSMKKIPTITLSINYRGVKFIDSKSKHEIAEHEISNISFASQDAEDLCTFAYITHDVRTGHHYCHVFRVTTLDVAFEIILTLGQAFEVAYQLILKDKELKGAEHR